MAEGREQAEVAFVQALRALALELPEDVYRDFAEKARTYMASVAKPQGRPRPDFDPRVDYPERFQDGPISC